jgi:hypothetical protein
VSWYLTIGTRQLVALAGMQYKSGAVDLLSVLQLQEAGIGARAELIKLRNAQLAHRIQLHLALGGSIDARPAGSPAAPDRPAKPSTTRPGAPNQSGPAYHAAPPPLHARPHETTHSIHPCSSNRCFSTSAISSRCYSGRTQGVTEFCEIQ